MTSTVRSQVIYVANFELVFPSREVVRVDWLSESVGWLMLVGWLFSPVISIYYVKINHIIRLMRGISKCKPT